MNFEHCEYNPFTLTGRPSNHFNGINYAALNKSDGSRKRFVSRHKRGYLVEFDLSGFHMYLIYMMLGQEFPENVYEELAKYYPPGENPKDYTFRQIYGGIDRDLLHIEPFSSIYDLEAHIFQQYKAGELKTFLFDRPINNEALKGLSQTKIFNYMLQNLETEFNALLLQKINELLKIYETKLILYTYDSFLFDYSCADSNLVLGKIQDLFDGIPFHFKAGHNYDELKLFK